MFRFRRKGTAYSRIDELSHDHFSFRKSSYHGFPVSPTAINFDPETKLLAIGTRNGELRIYGQPGVEFSGRIDTEKCITNVFSFGTLHQYITVQDDNTLLLWQLEGEESLPSLKIANEFLLDQERGKSITACCLSKLAGHFYIGTDSGNIYTLDVRLFMLKPDEVITFTNATALMEGSSDVHPGSVCSLQLCPSDFNKLLIGYEKGIICLWDVAQSLPERNYPSSLQENQKPLRSLAWQNEGQKFVTAHSDSSICYWNCNTSTPEKELIRYYGDSCEPIQCIKWLNSDSNPLIIFSGGLPSQDVDEHNTVTVIQGADHVALDFSSSIVDFVAVTDPNTKRGKVLIVLCQQEIMAFDLEAPKCPQLKKPYLYSIHASPVTCVQAYDGCPKELLQSFRNASSTNSANVNEVISNAEWPAMGGFIRVSDPPIFDMLITGHADGSIKFWDITSSAMYQIFEVKTGPIFQTSDSDVMDLALFSDFQWPPYRKVSTYDPFDDDSRLAIRLIEFCPYTCKLCVAGEGGQVLTFAFNPFPAEVRVEHVRAEIFIEHTTRSKGRGGGLRNSAPLDCKTDFLNFQAGFQPSLCVQCLPAKPVTALAFRPSWGLFAAGNGKGFMVANFYTKHIVLVHPTVMSDGIEARNIGRVQSLRRSLRSSLRRRSTSASAEERRKIAASLNLEMDIHGGGAKNPSKRAYSADAGLAIEDTGPIINTTVPPEQQGFVCHLVFAETHISGGGPHVSIIASTMGSSLIRYSIEVPKEEHKFESPCRAFPAGKDYALVHAAPIVAIFVLDHDAQPIPSPSEVENRAVPAPNMAGPHYAVIVTQEQVKIVSLPSMRSKRKEKINNLIHERIFKAWIIKVKVPAAPVGASRDWNCGLVILTTIGHLLIYSLPDIKLIYHKEFFILPSDQKAMQSLTISPNGETFHLRSFSELERRLLCAYNFSYHTSLLPNLHPYEGISGPVQIPNQSSAVAKPKEVTAEVNPVDIKPVPVAPLDTGVVPGSGGTSQRFRSPANSLHSISTEKSVRSRSMSPGATEKKKPEQLTNGIQSDRPDKLVIQPDQPDNADENSTDPVISPDEREVMASAAAFTQVYKTKERSSSSSSSSESDTESESEDDEEDEEGGGDTFGNPLVVDDELGDGHELDTIIASSLRQLESARAFYEQMQKHAGK